MNTSAHEKICSFQFQSNEVVALPVRAIVSRYGVFSFLFFYFYLNMPWTYFFLYSRILGAKFLLYLFIIISLRWIKMNFHLIIYQVQWKPSVTRHGNFEAPRTKAVGYLLLEMKILTDLKVLTWKNRRTVKKHW